jgi:hypothetical protein
MTDKPLVWSRPDVTDYFLWADPPHGSGRFDI